MAFTGKATYSAGATLPEIAEDVSDLVAISAAHETPLLDALGDADRPARSTIHEWLEDGLLPNSDTINDSTIANPAAATDFVVSNPGRFRPGDQVRVPSSGEVLLVTAVDLPTATLTVQRGYGGTSPDELADGAELLIIGNAALEGGDAPAARFTTRSRVSNATQIFSAGVEVSGSQLAVRQIGVKDELDYQKVQRTRELLRDLENSVINGLAPVADPQGSATVRRTMRGIRSFITTNIFSQETPGFPTGADLNEAQLNFVLRQMWRQSAGQVDLIVVGGQEKRAINAFISFNRRYSAQAESFKDMLSVYESDYGVCRIVMSRWVVPGTVLLLDSSRVQVLPLSGRSFFYKPLAATGDREAGQIIGEYTLELRNESAHGVIEGMGA